MQSVIEKLKLGFKQANIVQKFIYINVAIFVLQYLFNTLGWLFNSPSNLFFNFFSLPAQIDSFLIKPWTIITHGFLHGGFIHLLFNCIFLFYIGNLFTEYFIPKKFVTFYIWGTVFGGLLFFISFNYFPVFKNQQSYLVGASSAIMALLAGITTHMPNYALKIRFIGFVKLWVITAIFIFWDIINIPISNAGGHLAHLGGALFGYLAVYFNEFKISIPIPSRKTRLRTAFKSKKRKKTTQQKDSNTQTEIDKILDKISKSGYDSLTEAEKAFLFKQSNKS